MARTDFFGFHSSSQFAKQLYNDKNLAEETIKSNRGFNYAGNIARAIEWTPIIGQVVGVARMGFAAFTLILFWPEKGEKKNSEDVQVRKYCKLMIGRGAVAATGLGFIFLAVPDVVASGIRLYNSKKKPSDDNNAS